MEQQNQDGSAMTFDVFSDKQKIQIEVTEKFIFQQVLTEQEVEQAMKILASRDQMSKIKFMAEDSPFLCFKAAGDSRSAADKLFVQSIKHEKFESADTLLTMVEPKNALISISELSLADKNLEKLFFTTFRLVKTCKE